MGYRGSERTTRGGGGEAPLAARARAAHPTLDPRAGAVDAVGLRRRAAALWPLDVAVLCLVAWSRFRVVLPVLDRSLPSVVLALDRTLRRLGGVPTYALTDNERTVTQDHVCGMVIRNPKIVAASRHYGLTVATVCRPTRSRRAARRRRSGSRRPI